jgi:protein gp37
MAIDILGNPWNTITGCTFISPGCTHCYAKRLGEKFQNEGKPKYKDGFDKVVCHDDWLEDHPGTPMRTKKPKEWFVNSMADTFEKDVSDEFIQKIFAVMYQCPEHTFQVLTKRPKRMLQMVNDGLIEFKNNIWAGVSVEDVKRKARIDLLRQMPADIRFIMFEPLLESLGDLNLSLIHWAIVGGETDPEGNFRNMDIKWAREIRDQCSAQNVAFTFKQFSDCYAKEAKLDGKFCCERPEYEHEKPINNFNNLFE